MTISVNSVEKYYGNFKALNDASFTIEKGEIVGIVGSNGAGKSTLIDIIIGFSNPSNGTIEFDYGFENDNVRDFIGYVPEENTLYEYMTPKGYVLFFADLYSIPRNISESRVEELFDKLGLYKIDSTIGEMSKGMKRKVLIARSLIHDPDILIYDEPTSGLDPSITREIIDFIKSISDSDGKTVILSAHKLGNIERICDTVLIMNNGSIISNKSIDDLQAENTSNKYTIYSTVHITGSVEENGKYKIGIDDISEISQTILEIERNGGEVVDIEKNDVSLENTFHTLVS